MVIDRTSYIVDFEVFNYIDLAHLIPDITLSEDEQISIASVEEIDFSNGSVPYTVVENDESTEIWQAKDHPEPPRRSATLSFSLPEQTGDASIEKNIIQVEVLNYADLSSLTPLITVSDGDTITPASM